MSINNNRNFNNNGGNNRSRHFNNQQNDADEVFFTPNPTQRAVAILIPSQNGILSVSRPFKADKIGLPGGKCEKNEHFRHAAKRELKEETGIDLPLDRFEPVFLSQCGRFEVMTYYIKYDGFEIPGLNKSCEPGINVRWASKAELVEGPFGAYNAELFA